MSQVQGPRRARTRQRWDRGAVLIEYALVLFLLLVGSVGTIELLDRESRKEVNHQADCIATRPPPESCQPRPVTTADPSDPPTSPDTVAPPPDFTGAVSFTNGRIEDQPGGIWDAIVDVSLQVDGEQATPYGGATVRVRVTITAPPTPTPFFIDCLTAADGTCELRFTTPFPGVTGMNLAFEAVESFDGTVSPTGLPLDYSHP